MASWRPRLLALLAPVLCVWSHPLARNDGYHNTTTTCARNSYTLVSNDSGIWPYREYVTSNATSPEFKIETNGKSLAEGLVFLTPADTGTYGYNGTKQQGAMIMSQQGDLVWFGPTGDTSNLRTQRYRNETVTTVWTGVGAAAANGGTAHGYGTVSILNSKYETVETVCPTATSLNITLGVPTGNDSYCVADVHESYITDRNTMLVTVYNTTQANLTAVGGPAAGWVRNSLTVEVEIGTNKPVFVWNPLDHVPVKQSRVPLNGAGTNSSNPWDWFHTNSIQSFNGGYLINSRQTWSSYFVYEHGVIDWEINGETGGSFGTLPTGFNFSWQHEARLHPYGSTGDQVLYTCFNDANQVPTTHNPSIGLGMILNVPTNGSNSSTLKYTLEPYSHLLDPQDKLFPYGEGSYTPLDNGNGFVGYGIVPIMKEFGRASPNDTDVRYSAQFAYNNLNNTAGSYRTFKETWHATPVSPLSLVVLKKGANDTLTSCASDSGMRGYVSWNGATDVTHYDIYAGADESCLESTGVAFNKAGFETEFVVPEGMDYIQVAAFEGDKLVGKSNPEKAVA